MSMRKLLDEVQGLVYRLLSSKGKKEKKKKELLIQTITALVECCTKLYMW